MFLPNNLKQTSEKNVAMGGAQTHTSHRKKEYVYQTRKHRLLLMSKNTYICQM